MSVRMEVWGKYALFTRPEMKVERVSYDVMTPSAARGILEAVFWHPGMCWIIDRIHVCNPIQFVNIRRNEVSAKISASKIETAMKKGRADLYLATSETIQQRASLVLYDVRYVIEAHFEMTQAAAAGDNPAKFQEMITRRLEKGQCYHTPYLGTREFPAYFAPCSEDPKHPESLRGEKDLGYMLWDMDYSNPSDIRPLFYRARLKDGVLTVPGRTSGEVIG